ncbi:two-partner secretion domain-containing protein [Caballeronia concitans]
MLVAVAEDVVSQGKAPGEGSSSETGAVEGFRVVSALTAFAAAMLATQPGVSFAQALPTGGQVTAGQASISQNSNTMTINQGSQRTVIDWNSFNVGAGNTVQFNQPNAQSQALNRVSGGGASNIQGSLLANGQVLIQNANGVLFGKGSVVNVGSLLATTKAINPDAFMAGGTLQLNSTGTNASVVNDGSIQAQGYVTLVGDQVRNTGSINTAQGGQVVLAAGDSATVALPNGQGIQLTLTNATANALVENSGTIKADNGSVLLTARGTNTLLSTVVNLSGVVRAGTVVADAGNTGDVAVTGKIDASNNAAGGVGGTVVLSGDRVGVFGNASIDASGDAAGGKVIIGGDSLKKLNGTSAAGMLQDGVQFANYTQVDMGARISAGSAHGNGGFVETSGHSLDVQGAVSAAAPNGKAGEWLIDPTNVTISGNADSGYSGGVTSGFSGGSNDSATVNNATISNALNAGTDVTITTASSGAATGTITQTQGADIVKSGGAAATLTLAANGDITLAGNITSTSNKLNVNLTAAMGSTTGHVWQQSNSTIDLNGGNLTVNADATGKSDNGVALNNVLNVGGGSINGFASIGDGVVISGNFTKVGSGTLTVNGSSNSYVGVRFGENSNLTQTAGLMTVAGTSTEGYGVQFGTSSFQGLAHVSVFNNATLDVTGTSMNAGGVSVGSIGYPVSAVAVNVTDNATFNIQGTSTNGPGVGFWKTTNNVSGHGTLNITGTSVAGEGVAIDTRNGGYWPNFAAFDVTNSGTLKVGIVFKGNPTHENDSQRSLPSLGVLDDLVKLGGVEFFSLQKGAGADEAARYGQLYRNFHDIGPGLNTMAETASAIAALDIVLTVDTSVAHVAGAMGKPVWLMLPSYGDWRWHYTREDSPWYPTMRLFRRRFGCDWSEVVARLAGHMRQAVMEKAQRAVTA